MVFLVGEHDPIEDYDPGEKIVQVQGGAGTLKSYI